MFYEKWIPPYETLESIGISIGILLLFLVFRKLFTKYVFKVILKISKKTPTEFFTHLFLAFEQPLRWVFLIIGIYVAVGYFPYLEQSNPLFLKFIRSSVIGIIAWGLYNLASGSSLLFMKINERTSIKIDEILIPFVSKAIRLPI